MIKLIDRQMVRGYFKSYLACLASLLCLYIVVDLFVNLDDFMHRKDQQGLEAILRHVLSYYSCMITKIFDMMSEPTALLAAMFTVALLQRNNEQLPLLSAGVSTQRIVTPVLLCAAAVLSLSVLNQELVIPRIGERLFDAKEDPEGLKELQVHQAYEPNDIQIDSKDGKATRKAQRVTHFECIIPKKIAGNLLFLWAEEAYYRPPGSGGERQGGWEMMGVQPAENVVPLDWNGQPVLEVIDKGHYFLHTRVVDFDTLTHTHNNWYQAASTRRLYEELQRAASTTRLAPMAVLFHMRLTRPVLGLLLVLMGLSVILRDQNRNVFISSGLCLVLCGLYFGVVYSCKMLGDYDLLEPALAAWLPVLFFGPLALVLFDAVHT
jgi:lipopolysaccharide export system permease protein